MTRSTSNRHTDILNGYKSGGSRFNDWVSEKLGDIALDHWTWGELRLTWKIDERFLMPDGVMFGGHIASVGDHLAGLAAMSVLTDDRERFRTTRLEIEYFRPLTRTEAAIEARVVNASKNLIHVDAEIRNGENKLCNRVQATQLRRMTG
ncbi:MAG: PaaI family thioesterase [Pseudomonadota bacterium]